MREWDKCWLGAGVIVCPGVTIDEGAVIGASSVVTRDIPPIASPSATRAGSSAAPLNHSAKDLAMHRLFPSET